MRLLFTFYMFEHKKKTAFQRHRIVRKQFPWPQIDLTVSCMGYPWPSYFVGGNPFVSMFSSLFLIPLLFEAAWNALDMSGYPASHCTSCPLESTTSAAAPGGPRPKGAWPFGRIWGSQQLHLLHVGLLTLGFIWLQPSMESMGFLWFFFKDLQMRPENVSFATLSQGKDLCQKLSDRLENGAVGLRHGTKP